MYIFQGMCVLLLGTEANTVLAMRTRCRLLTERELGPRLLLIIAAYEYTPHPLDLITVSKQKIWPPRLKMSYC